MTIKGAVHAMCCNCSRSGMKPESTPIPHHLTHVSAQHVSHLPPVASRIKETAYQTSPESSQKPHLPVRKVKKWAGLANTTTPPPHTGGSPTFSHHVTRQILNRRLRHPVAACDSLADIRADCVNNTVGGQSHWVRKRTTDYGTPEEQSLQSEKPTTRSDIYRT